MWWPWPRDAYREIKARDLTGAEPLNGLMCHTIVGHAALWDVTRDRPRALEGIIATGSTAAGYRRCARTCRRASPPWRVGRPGRRG